MRTAPGLALHLQLSRVLRSRREQGPKPGLEDIHGGVRRPRCPKSRGQAFTWVAGAEQVVAACGERTSE